MKITHLIIFTLLFILPFDTCCKASQPPLDAKEEEEEIADPTSVSLVPQNAWVMDFEARLNLARAYSYQKKFQRQALEQYKILLRQEPADPILLFETGRTYQALKQYEEALNFFYSTLELKPNSKKVLLATAQTEAALGRAVKSNQFMQKILSLNDQDSSASKYLVSYADLMMMWGDFYKAEEIYRHALAQKPHSLKLALNLAWTLTSEQRYDEAEKLYRKLLAIHPNHPKILKALIELKNLAKNFDSALIYLEQLLAFHPKPAYFLIKAHTLYLKGSYEQALPLYLAALKLCPVKNAIQAYLGLAKSYFKLNWLEESALMFNKILGLNPENISAQYYATVLAGENTLCLNAVIKGSNSIKNLEELAAVYLENGQSEVPKNLYQTITEIDSEYFPAQMNLAEMLAINFEFEAALAIYMGLLENFPDNSKIMLSIARVHAWAKEYDTSLLWFDALLALNPRNPVVLLEKARVAIWGKQFDFSMTIYDQLLSLAEELEIETLQETAGLEKEEKKLSWHKRYRHTFPVLEELIELMPGNEEALYDEAQNYCSIGRCDFARKIYQHILYIDANHNLVKLALERNLIHLNRALQGHFAYWRELGSGSFSQSQIARYYLNASVEQPLSCSSRVRFIQDQYVENTFYDRKYHPAEGQTIEGECLFNNYVSGSAGATYKNYFGQFKSQYTGRIQLNVNGHDFYDVTLGINRENEVSNFFSIKQGIQYVASCITVSSNLSKFWYIEGSFKHLDFNDGNWREHCMLMTSYAFTDTPNVYKIILKGNYLNTEHQTINIFVGPQLVDVIHPYWTPDKYFEGSITFQWRHDYRFFEYCEAPQRYLDVKITAGQDNTHNPSIELVVEWKHEFERHWGIEFKGLIHRSPLWNAEGAWASLSYRF